MYTLKAEIRDMNIKAKKLRREGFVPAAIYGKNLDEPILLQIEKSDAERFVSRMSKVKTLSIEVGDESHDVLYKEIALDPISHKPEHFEFQNLIAGETINTVSRVVVLNKDENKNIINVHTEEIPYSAESKDFVNEVTIDVEGLEDGTVIKLEDLDIAKDEKIRLALPLDTIILTVEEPVIMTDEEFAELESGEAAAETTEPEVIGEEDAEETE